MNTEFISDLTVEERDRRLIENAKHISALQDIQEYVKTIADKKFDSSIHTFNTLYSEYYIKEVSIEEGMSLYIGTKNSGKSKHVFKSIKMPNGSKYYYEII